MSSYPLDRFTEWARGRVDVLGIVMIGSQARAETPADDLSDLDVIVFVEDVSTFIDHDGWLGELGDFLVASRELSGEYYYEREILYRDGAKLDMIFVPSSHLARWPDTGLEPGMAGVVRRGSKIVFATDQIKGSIERAKASALSPPPEREFSSDIGRFLIDCASGARKLSRGETWMVRDFVEAWLRPEVVKMLELRARARGDEPWPSGRFMERWVEPEVLGELRSITIRRLDAREVHDALTRMMKLYLRIASEVADALGYPFPSDAVAEISKWVADLRPVT